jgi:hypothetical protein
VKNARSGDDEGVIVNPHDFIIPATRSAVEQALILFGFEINQGDAGVRIKRCSEPPVSFVQFHFKGFRPVQVRQQFSTASGSARASQHRRTAEAPLATARGTDFRSADRRSPARYRSRY